MKLSQKGSITVFLSLILLLIISVIMTTVEAARVSVAKTFTERSLLTAMDSVLAEYYSPLFENYHIFGLNGGYGTDSMQEDEVINKLKDYMNYTFNPTDNLKYQDYLLNLDNFNPFEIQIDDLQLNNTNTLLNYNGELFTTQAISFMKYKEIGNGLQSFLKKTATIKDTNKAGEILKQKLDTEESIYQIDKNILKLMKLIDGISISKEGVNFDSSGNIEVEDYFVKKIYSESIQNNMGINNPMVFSSLQSHYINMDEQLDKLITDMILLLDNLEKKKEARINYHFLSLIDTSEIEDKQEIKDIKRRLKEAKEELDNCMEREEDLIKLFNTDLLEFKNQLQNIKNKIVETYPIIEQLIIDQNIASNKIEEYEVFLESQKGLLSEDFYESLVNDLEFLNKYKHSKESDTKLNNYNFQGIKDTLNFNETLLNTAISSLDISLVVNETELNSLQTLFSQVKSNLKQYSYKNLQFDYSTLTVPVESDSFFDGIKNTLKGGIFDLLVEDKSKLSDKSLSATDLPSYYSNDSNKSKNSNHSNLNPESTISNLNINSDTSALTQVMSVFGENIGALDKVIQTGNNISNIVLFQEYLFEHFKNYGLTNPGGNQTSNNLNTLETTLNYELEYILCGNKKDYDNLKEVAMQILLIRVVMNSIALMGDAKRSNEAKILAAGFVGFSGMPALVAMVKYIIILFWAFAESLVDVAAILKGKEVPIVKNSTNIQLELNELLLVNHTLIQTKSNNYKSTQSVATFHYNDYLRLFLLIRGQEKINYRAMDLIQENLQLNYEDNFYMKNCLFGIQAKAKFKMKEKFIALPFVKQILNNSNEEYMFETIKEYSY